MTPTRNAEHHPGALGAASLQHRWLSDPHIVMWSLLVVSLWGALGLNMLIFFAGIQGVDQTLYEAAQVDGANQWAQFWNVTIPSLRVVTAIVISLNLMNGFKVFDLVYVMTAGGPDHASEVFGTYLYSLAFGSTAGSIPQLGYGSAFSVIVMALCSSLWWFRWRSPDWRDDDRSHTTVHRRSRLRAPLTGRRRRLAAGGEVVAGDHPDGDIGTDDLPPDLARPDLDPAGEHRVRWQPTADVSDPPRVPDRLAQPTSAGTSSTAWSSLCHGAGSRDPSTLAGYAFATLRFPFKNVIYVGLLVTLMMPSTALIIPLYQQLKSFGLLNSRLGLVVLYVSSSAPFAMFLMRAFFETLPRNSPRRHALILRENFRSSCGSFCR